MFEEQIEQMEENGRKSARFTFRTDRRDKILCRMLGINISTVCRNAVKAAIIQRKKTGQLPIPAIESRVHAAQCFNRLMPVWDQIITIETAETLIENPERLLYLKRFFPQIPDKFLLDFARFIQGGDHAEYVLLQFLDGFEG